MEGSTKPAALSELARLRRAAGLTQRELAEALGMRTVRTITSWESGRNAPHVVYILPLARILGVSPRRVIEAVVGPDPGRCEMLPDSDSGRTGLDEEAGVRSDTLAALASNLLDATELVRRLQDGLTPPSNVAPCDAVG